MRDSSFSPLTVPPEPSLPQQDDASERGAEVGSLLSSDMPDGPQTGDLLSVALPEPASGRPGLAHQWWPWFLVATTLHGLALLALLRYGALSETTSPEETLQVVEEIDLTGLGGGGGGGGDGRESGEAGAGNQAAAGEASQEAAPPEPTPATQTPPPAAPEPAPQPAPPPTASLEPPVEKKRVIPPPKPAPPKKVRPVVHKPDAPQSVAAAAPAAPVAQAPAAEPVATPGNGSGTGSGTGTGNSGDGPGRGAGHSPGAGGVGAGAGGGLGNGTYEGQFGQGDGPRFRHRALPRYPDEAKRSGREGSVSLRLRIDASGVLRDVEVVGHCGLDFVEEALRAIRASTFYPAMRQGQAMPCNAVLTIRFTLS